MSLLDDVSIVVTPNGYKAGTLYGVIPTATEGSNQVINGDFSNGTTGWQLQYTGTGDWSITDKLNFVNVNGGSAQLNVFEVGKIYKITVDYVFTSGTRLILPYDGSNFPTGGVITTTGSVNGYTYYYTPNSTTLLIYSDGNGNGSVDNVSVKEWTASDMDVTRATAATRVDENGLVNFAEVLGSELVTNGDYTNGLTGWGTQIPSGQIVEVTSNQLHIDYDTSQTQGSTGVFQTILTLTKTYKTTIDIASVTGTFKVQVGNVIHTITTPGVKTFYNVASDTAIFIGRKSNAQGFEATINSVSVKEVTRDNVPRIDYTGGGCPHILAEPQRTNLVTYSENFNQWNKIGITVTSNSLISPDGTQNAGKLVATSGASSKVIYQSISANTYTASVFAKKGEFEGLLIATGTTGAFFNLNTNTYRTHYTSPPTSYKIVNYGNGWYRYSITFTQSSSDNLYIGINDNVSTTFAITGNGTNGIYTFGAQLEAGSFATSYISTSGSTVTRNQDLFTRDGIGSLINSPEGVLFLEMAALSNSGNYRLITLSDGNTSNRVFIGFRLDTGYIYYFVIVGGSTVASHITSTTSLDFSKIAVKWKANDFALWIDGSEISTVTSGSSFSANTLNTLQMNEGDGSGFEFHGKVKQLQIFKNALSDSELATLTT